MFHECTEPNGNSTRKVFLPLNRPYDSKKGGLPENSAVPIASTTLACDVHGCDDKPVGWSQTFRSRRRATSVRTQFHPTPGSRSGCSDGMNSLNDVVQEKCWTII